MYDPPLDISEYGLTQVSLSIPSTPFCTLKLEYFDATQAEFVLQIPKRSLSSRGLSSVRYLFRLNNSSALIISQGEKIWPEYARYDIFAPQPVKICSFACSYLRRPGESIHQKNHVPTQQMDAWSKNLETCYCHHEQRNWRTC